MQIPSLSSKERQDLIDEIMKDLKLQSDRRRDLTTRKSIIINPQLFATTNPSRFGPYYFETKFIKNPFATFGQARLDQTRIKGIFVVQPYIDSWISDSGGINGFYLGAYALTSVPPGLTRHTITWSMIGKASLYKSDSTNDNWIGAYDNRTASHLYFDDGTLEKPLS